MHRLVAPFALVLTLTACGVAEKDYSHVTPLMPVKPEVAVKPVWVAPTGELPKSANAQMPPRVVDGQLFLANAGGDVGRLDVRTGSLAWVTTLDDKLTGGPGAGGGLVLAGTRKAQLVALDADSGKERWRGRLSSETLAVPQVAGDLVIVQCIDGQVLALDRNDGKQRWNYSHNTPALTLRGTSSPLVVDERVIAGFADGVLVSLSLKTGEVQWESTVAIPRGRNDLERLVDIDGLFRAEDGVIYVASYQGRIAAVASGDGNILWARDMSSYVGLTVGESQVFVTDAQGQVWALDRRTGATLWRQDKLKDREVSAPALVGGQVAVADFEGYVHWLSSDDGRFTARSSMDQAWARFRYVWPNVDGPDEKPPLRSVTTPPLAAGNELLVRDNLGALAVFRVEPPVSSSAK
jgi:outer membrane protein assembly factor BamB